MVLGKPLACSRPPFFFIPFAFVPIKSRASKAILLFSNSWQVGFSCPLLVRKLTSAPYFGTKSPPPQTLALPNQLPQPSAFSYISSQTPNRVIRLSSGVSSENIIDLSSYDSFVGLNLWPIHALKFLGQNSLCHGGSLAMLALLIAIMSLLLYKLIPALTEKTSQMNHLDQPSFDK